MAADMGTARDLNAHLDVAVSPQAMWAVISDLRRTPEWSPECIGVYPKGAVAEGTWFVGLNRRGWVRWPTLSQVISFRPEAEVGWWVRTNGARWFYRLEPIEVDGAVGTRITQTRRTPKGVGLVARWFTIALLSGQVGHDNELEDGMREGLVRIADLARAAAGGSPAR